VAADSSCDVADDLIRIWCKGGHVNEARHFGSTPASVMTAPPQEWPTRMTGPVCRASARLVAATSSANEVNGFAPP